MKARTLWIMGWCALCLLAASASAQVPERIALGERRSGTAAGDGGVFYAFAAVQGTRLQATLAMPELRGAVTLYGAEGIELARAEGEGTVSLAHTLDEDGIYLIGITSAEASKDYTLALDGQEPRIEYVYDEPLLPSGEGAPPVAPPVLNASPAPVALASPFVADPAVWGVYARLAGRRSVPDPDRYDLTWTWVRPGEELLEEWRDTRGRVVSTIVIRPGGTPGTLQLRSSMLGGKEWVGRIGDGGHVTFVGVGLTKLPFVVEIAADGTYQLRRAKVDANGQPTTIQPAGRYSRWALAPAGD